MGNEASWEPSRDEWVHTATDPASARTPRATCVHRPVDSLVSMLSSNTFDRSTPNTKWRPHLPSAACERLFCDGYCPENNRAGASERARTEAGTTAAGPATTAAARLLQH